MPVIVPPWRTSDSAIHSSFFLLPFISRMEEREPVGPCRQAPTLLRFFPVQVGSRHPERYLYPTGGHYMNELIQDDQPHRWFVDVTVGPATAPAFKREEALWAATYFTQTHVAIIQPNWSTAVTPLLHDRRRQLWFADAEEDRRETKLALYAA